MSTKGIRAALEGRLATWAATQSLQVAYQNVHFTEPAATYLRPFMLPAPTFSDDLEGAHRGHHGIFQINVVAPIGNGPGAAESIAEALAALFPLNQPDLRAAGVNITEPMTFGRGIPDSERYTLPVFCRYRADTI